MTGSHHEPIAGRSGIEESIHQEHLEHPDREYPAEYRYRLHSDGTLTREKICEECGYVTETDELEATGLRVYQKDRVLDTKGRCE